MVAGTRLRHSMISLSDGKRLHYPLDLGFDWAGLSVIPSNIDVHDIDDSAKFPIGTILESPYARYRYVEYGGTAAAGTLVQAEVPDGAHDNLTPSAAASAGDTQITISDSITLVANEYVGGSLFVEDAATGGAGYAYQIIKHDADAAAGGAVFTVDQGFAVGIAAAAEVNLIKSIYKEVIIHPSPPTAALAGFAQGAGANGKFGWVCTRGRTAALADTTLVAGEGVIASVNVNGAVGPWLIADTSAVEKPVIGHVLDVPADTEYTVIEARLE